MKKGILLIVGVLVVILALFFVYSASEFDTDVGNVTLNVSSEGPHELSKIIEEIRTLEYYKGYDNETVAWMESLGNKSVWFGDDVIVLMDKTDSDRIPSEFVTDVSINDIFTCNIVEKHPIGNVKYPRDVVLVDHVEFVKQEIHYYEV